MGTEEEADLRKRVVNQVLHVGNVRICGISKWGKLALWL